MNVQFRRRELRTEAGSLCMATLAGLAMATVATSAAGQEQPVAAADQESRSAAAEMVGRRFAARLPVETASMSGLARPSIQFQAEGDSSEVAIVMGRPRKEGSWISGWSVRFATPVQEGETFGNFITDDGLTGSSSVRIGVSHVSGLPRAWAERANLSPTDEARLVDADLDAARIWLWTAALGVGHQEINWRDPLSLAEQDTQRTAYVLSLSGGVRPRGNDLPIYIGGGLELAREYRAGDTRTLCAPPPASGPQECFTGPFGAPEPHDTQVVNLIGRFQGDWIVPFAIELQPAYDIRHDVAELAATLYFVPDSDRGLRGGLRARWRTEDDDPMTDDDRFTFGVFVGAPFSLGLQ